MRAGIWEYRRVRKQANIPLTLTDNIQLLVRYDDGIGRLISDFGIPEPGVFRLMQRTLKADMTFVDVGANIGTHTVFAAKLVCPSGRVIAYEPNPETYGQTSPKYCT